MNEDVPICTRHGIPYKTKKMEFSNKEEVKVWIINNQLGRRNLPEFVQYELRQKEKELLYRKGKQTQGTRTDLLSNVDKKLGHNTRKEIAKKLNWASGKVAQADFVLKKAPEEVKEKLRKNEMTIHQAYREIKIKEIAKAIRQLTVGVA